MSPFHNFTVRSATPPLGRTTRAPSRCARSSGRRQAGRYAAFQHPQRLVVAGAEVEVAHPGDPAAGKVMQDAGMKLTSVASTLLGKSGRAIIDALLTGESDSAVSASWPRAGCGRSSRAAPGPVGYSRSSITGCWWPRCWPTSICSKTPWRRWISVIVGGPDSATALGDLLSLREYLQLLRDGKWWIAAGLLFGMLGGLLIALTSVPTYVATTTLYFAAIEGGGEPGQAYQGALLAEQKARAYAQLIVSDRVLDEVRFDTTGACRHGCGPVARSAITVQSAPETRR